MRSSCEVGEACLLVPSEVKLNSPVGMGRGGGRARRLGVGTRSFCEEGVWASLLLPIDMGACVELTAGRACPKHLLAPGGDPAAPNPPVLLPFPLRQCPPS